MKDTQVMQGDMCGAVGRFTEEKAEKLALVPAAVSEGKDVRDAYKLFTDKTPEGIVETKEVTQKAETAEKLLRTMLPALLGPLASVASKGKNMELLAQATLRVRQLERLSPQELDSLATMLIGIGEDQPKDIKDKYALGLILPTLRGYQTDFQPLIGQTQDIIDGRASDNRTAAQLLQATLQQVYELDKVMLAFKILDPTLYTEYRKARKIGKRSGGGGKKGGNGEAPKV